MALQPPHAVRELVAKGCDGGFTRAQSIALARYAHRLLLAGDPQSNDQLVDTLHGLNDRSMQRNRPAEPHACSRGCAWCCHGQISINAVEAFTMARRLRASRDNAPRLQRLRAYAHVPPGDDRDRSWRVANRCSMLEDGVCSAYAVRPLSCRQMASLDVQACVRAFEGIAFEIPWPQNYRNIRGWVAIALYAAQKAAGLPATGYEINQALLIALEDPGAEARWYAGSDALAPAAGDLDRPQPLLMAEVDKLIAEAGLGAAS